MKRIQSKALLKSRDRLSVTLRLQLQLAQKVQRISVARIDPGNVLESLECCGGLRHGPVGETEVIPGARALRLTPGCIEKNVARFGKLLAIEQRDTFVQARCKKIWILRQCTAECDQSFGNARLI